MTMCVRMCVCVCVCERSPAHIVVAEHHSFGLARGPGRVDERAALRGLLGGDDVIQLGFRNLPAQLHELRPLRNTEPRVNTRRTDVPFPPTGTEDTRRVLTRETIDKLTVYRFGLFSLDRKSVV